MDHPLYHCATNCIVRACAHMYVSRCTNATVVCFAIAMAPQSSSRESGVPRAASAQDPAAHQAHEEHRYGTVRRTLAECTAYLMA